LLIAHLAEGFAKQGKPHTTFSAVLGVANGCARVAESFKNFGFPAAVTGTYGRSFHLAENIYTRVLRL
jgi:hypothetical protein